MKVTINRLAIIVTLWAAVFAGLVIGDFNPFALTAVVGFPFLLFVPGYLTVLLLRVGQIQVLPKFLFAVGFSLIELMIVPFIGNAFLPILGIARPLEQEVLLLEIGLLVFGQLGWLAIRAKRRNRQVVDDIVKRAWIIPNKLNAIFALVPVAFVGGAVSGAFLLNNQVGNYLTLATLIGMVVYLGFLFANLRRLNEGTLLISITLMGLALLLMTSMRGWFVTGHDVQREYHVFLLTQLSGHWSMEHLRDAYNACLSITVLPTVLSNLLHIGGDYVYKLLFQIIFALTPAIVFVIARQFTTKLIATLAAVFFISFPTFFGDMPMLNRQEIAFVFLGLALLALFNDTLSLRHKKIIFYAMSLAIIVSHYSTNYTLIGILVVFLVVQFIMRLLARKLVWRKLSTLRNVLNLDMWAKKEKGTITITTVAVLVAASFLWSVQLTQTAGDSLGRVGVETVNNIIIALKNDSQQQKDDEYSYVELKKLEPQEKLQKYFEQNITYSRQHHDPSLFYDESTYNKYDYRVVQEETAPLTPLGESLKSFGLPVEAVSEGLRQGNADLRQWLARFMQITIIVGVVVLFFGKQFRDTFTNEYRVLQFASIFMLIAMIALPVLSAAYGLSRAFQQVMLLAGVPLVIGFLALFPRVIKKAGKVLIVCIAMLFFVSLTGIPTGLLGGYTPQLHLFNSGKYYDLYYTHQQEVTGTRWLADLIARQKIGDRLQVDQVFIDRYTDFKVPNMGIDLNALDDVYPGLLRKDSYVFLGKAATTKSQVTVFYNGDTITYEYPMEFLDDNKNLIYSNGGAKVYR